MDRKELESNTLVYYNNNAKEFMAHRGEGVSQYWSKELARFKELLPEGNVLEVGCGIGNEAVLLSEMGYGYTGTDISLGMLSVAKSRLSGGKFVCQDLRVQGFSSEFDGILGFASLLHLRKDELTPALSILRKQLRSKGIGLFTLKEGIGTEVDAKGRFYSYYSLGELSRHMMYSGFDLIDITTHEEKGHSFICCFVQNP